MNYPLYIYNNNIINANTTVSVKFLQLSCYTHFFFKFQHVVQTLI